MLGALGCGSCPDIDLHIAAELFVGLARVLLLLLVKIAWVKCVSEINRAKRRMALAPSRLRLGFRRASNVLVCGDKDCKLLGEMDRLGIRFGRFLPDLILLLRVTKCLLCLMSKSVVGQSGKLEVVG